MANSIMIGCDLHERDILLRFFEINGKPEQASLNNDERRRARMIFRLQTDAKDAQMLLEQARGFVLAGNTAGRTGAPATATRRSGTGAGTSRFGG